MIVMPPPPSNQHIIAAAALAGSKPAGDDRFDRFLRLFPLRVGLFFVAIGLAFLGLSLWLPDGLYTVGLRFGACLGGIIGGFWLLVYGFEASR